MARVYVLCVLIILLFVGVMSHRSDFVRLFGQIDVDPAPVAANTNKSFKTVCYFAMPKSLNTTVEHPIPKGLNTQLCSHIIFIPTEIDDHNRIVPYTPSHYDMFSRAVPAMRKENPKLTIMVSNVGRFSPVMQSLQNTSEYVNSVVTFLRKYDFDGIDLDWEFPNPTQFRNFSRVFTELRKAFEQEAIQTKRPRLLLTAAVLTGETTAERIYDFDNMKNDLDFVNMMGYDYHGPGGMWTMTDYNSPLTTLAYSATFWASKIGKEKVVVGIPFYCHAFKLMIPFMHGYHDFSHGAGECNNLGHVCACDAINNKNATVVFDGYYKVPYCYYGNQWISFENIDSIRYKTKWILDNGFPGLMVWEMLADDVEGVCDGKTKYPLMNTVLQTIYDHGK